MFRNRRAPFEDMIGLAEGGLNRGWGKTKKAGNIRSQPSIQPRQFNWQVALLELNRQDVAHEGEALDGEL